VRPVLQVQPALPGAAASAPWHVSGPMHLLSSEHNLDERDGPRKRRFDQMDEVRITWINGSTCPADQPPQPHSKAILGVPERRRFITRHGVRPATPRGPTAPPNRHTGRNRPKERTLNRLRSSDQERPRREAVDHRADHTPWSDRTCHFGPTRSTDLPCL
jgi:hypothetical protein